jgi:hypothetical protein
LRLGKAARRTASPENDHTGAGKCARCGIEERYTRCTQKSEECVIGDGASVRGRTLVAAILDEFAFWAHEDAIEVLRALRPAMATQPESMWLVCSSVYACNGPFYEMREAHFGVDDPRVLFAVATSAQ